MYKKTLKDKKKRYAGIQIVRILLNVKTFCLLERKHFSRFANIVFIERIFVNSHLKRKKSFSFFNCWRFSSEIINITKIQIDFQEQKL